MPDLSATLGGSVYLLLLTPALAGLALHAYRRPGHSRSIAFRALFALRISALLIAVALLIDPLFALTVLHSRPPVIALLVDDSASMGIEDGKGSRRQITLDLLQNHRVRQALAGAGEVQAFAFAESLRAFDLSSMGVEERGGALKPQASSLSPLKWDGPATDLGGALIALSDRFKGHDLAAVVLTSDGAANVGTDPEKASSLLKAPVYAVGVGDPEEPRDVTVVSALCDPAGIAGREMTVRTAIRSSGYAGKRVPVEIRASGKLLVTHPVLLEDGEQQVDLILKPENPGRGTYEVRVPPQSDERSEANNSAFFGLDVLKGRNRVLLVSGSPNPDFGYLRRLLISDPNKEADAFVSSSKGGFSRENAPLSRLKGYDLVILADLPASALTGVGRAIEDFVRAGGGLLVIGGANAFDGGYDASALRDILPVRPVASGASFQEDRFQLKFSGTVHPILRLSDDPEADERTRSEWPPLLGFNRTLGVRSGASVLAVHPRVRTPDGDAMPLIAVATVGAGRVMAVTCGTLYRLDALMWGIGKTGEAPATLWKNAFQWLLTPETARRVAIVPDRPVWKNGEPVALRAAVYDPLMRPLRGGTVTVSVSDTLGSRTANLAEVGEGRYAGQVRGLSPGDHRFEGRAEVDGAEIGRDAGNFTVSAASLEFERLRMNEDLLRRIARASGGAFCRPEELPALLSGLKLMPKVVPETYRVQAWGSPYALSLFIALLAAEWILRRRRGML